MNIFLARQPIFDRKMNVFGYELLFRSGTKNYYDGTDASADSLNVISNALLILGLEEVTGGRKAFINFGEGLLKSSVVLSLPKALTVIEILEDAKVDDELVTICRDFHDQGYLICLDDFALENESMHALLTFADIVKVDVQAVKGENRRKTVELLRKRDLKMLAEKVETREEYKEAVDLGYTLFQGYFFCEPTIMVSKDIPHNKMAYLRFIHEVNRPEMDFDRLEQTIKQDTGLCFKLLKYMNSAFFGFRQKIASVRQALALLGEKNIKRWATLVAFVNLCTDCPMEVLRTSIVRANLCSHLALKTGMDKTEPELYLIGMFSLIDVILGREMRQVLDHIPLSDTAKRTLLGDSTRYRDILHLVVTYERADWRRYMDCAARLQLDEADLPHRYFDSINSVNSIIRLSSE